MTTTVTIKTVEGDKESNFMIVVGDVAQNHVLRSFNPAMKEDDAVGAKVDATKVLCAALIQQMIDLRDAPGATGFQKRAAAIGITQMELVQMPLVKANFVKA
jgi:hypothetical protein